MIQKKTGYKITSGILSAALTAGILPGLAMTSFADGYAAEVWSPDQQTKLGSYETFEDAVAAANDAGAYAGVRLLEDTEVKGELTLTEDLNIFVNGYTFTVAEDAEILGDDYGIDMFADTSEGSSGIVEIKGHVEPFLDICSSDLLVNVTGGKIDYFICDDGFVNVNEGAFIPYFMISDGIICISGGEVQYAQLFDGILSVTDGEIMTLCIDGGGAVITGGKIDCIGVLNNMGAPMVSIKGDTQIDEAMFDFYGSNNECGESYISIAEEATIRMMRITMDEDTMCNNEGMYGHIDIEGGYFGFDPSAAEALAELTDVQKSHLDYAADEEKIDEYTGQNDWKADPDIYPFRIAGPVEEYFTGWEEYDGEWYYFVDDRVVTGWYKVEGVWYYFDPETGAMVTGWKQIEGKWYYFVNNGSMVTGWKEIGKRWYYFTTSGDMVTGWKSIGGKWYYFNAGGDMATGWKEIGKVWYYFEKSGAMVTGWKEIGGFYYYFKPSGAMASNEYIGGYRLDAGGKWTYKEKASWRKDSKGWWYGDNKGWYAKNETRKIDGTDYAFDASGYWIEK